MKERVERVLEHNPVEKQYVVETRFVGEAPIPSATGATVIDTTGMLRCMLHTRRNPVLSTVHHG